MYKLFFLTTLLCSSAFAHDHYPSLPSKVLSHFDTKAVTDRSPAAQAKAANAFLALLTTEQKKHTLLPLDSKERQNWTNLAPKEVEQGARLGDLNEAQLNAALTLLATALSEQGFHQVWSIPLADDQLNTKGRKRPGFGAEDYRLVLFGTPDPKKPWALQFDGHHLAINLTIKGEQMCLSPSFLGTRPHTFKIGETDIRPLQALADLAHTLVLSLPEAQQKHAIISQKRGKIRTAAGKDGVIPPAKGIAVSQFNKAQKEQLMQLISCYVNALPSHASKKRMLQLRSQLDQMHFSWSGPTAHKSDVSYHIQGPSLIIEYACQSGGNPLDHIHAMYRDPSNEYGKAFSPRTDSPATTQ